MAMYTEISDYRPRRSSHKKMEPDCAVCHAPANLHCPCEGQMLDKCIEASEERTLQLVFQNVRLWVREHAKEYILTYFNLLRDQRRLNYHRQLDQINAFAYQNFNLPPNPVDLKSAEDQYKRGVDEDWRSSVARYPEVLDYFFSLTEVALPGDHEESVKNAPLAAMKPSKPIQARINALPTSTHAGQAGTVAASSNAGTEMGMVYVPSASVAHTRGGRTPPPPPSSERMDRMERIERRRTPGPPQPPPPGQHGMAPRRHQSFRRNPHHAPPQSLYHY